MTKDITLIHIELILTGEGLAVPVILSLNRELMKKKVVLQYYMFCYFAYDERTNTLYAPFGASNLTVLLVLSRINCAERLRLRGG